MKKAIYARIYSNFINKILKALNINFSIEFYFSDQKIRRRRSHTKFTYASKNNKVYLQLKLFFIVIERSYFRDLK